MPARSTVLSAWLDGWRRVFRAPVLVVGLLALTSMHTVLPPETRAELWTGGAVDHEDADRATADAKRFTADTYGLGWALLHPSFGLGRSGGAAAMLVLGPLLLAPMPLTPPVLPMLHMVAVDLVGMTVILFLAGGVMDRLARDRPVRSHAFFAACGGYLFRFLRLGVPLGLVYWLLLRWLYPWLIGSVFLRLASGATANTVEATRLTIYSVFTILLVIVSVIGDYAMVRTVVEDRRSALGSLMAGARFVRQRLLRVLVLYVLTAAVPMAVFVALTRVAPRSLAFVLDHEAFASLFFGALMLFFQLAYLASATAFFQGELAHAQYTAAPVPIWPESPAAEAIRNLTKVS